MKYDNRLCVISGFRRGPIFKGLQGLTLNVETVDFPETLTTNYKSVLLKIPEERSSRQTLCPKICIQTRCNLLAKNASCKLRPPELCSSD
jgi:hypothetical protein